ncbi:radical SAM superfamily protein [bacterium BMS3Bbin14]|nr:radical SAM superfamily protein [bacterium BMS3Abin13]GBE51641.1 radical SAM superfamily protein [bacterium BMS3Bbin14]HDL98797.1 radical SAM protein [Desulfobacteraceae bacterium]HDO31346.1 radical SAM protein [Desulfobacteraceae bacterium]HDZ75811.1 radical SAM protein [Desulfobacteraceae bacterium]
MQKHLNTCTGCPRQCRVDRKSGRAGFCGMNAGIKISHAGLHFGEEPPISGSNGSGAIFFAGCNLRCVFCQNFQVSQEFRHGRTRDLTVEELASEALRLQDAGAHNINFVSPSHLIFQMAEAIVAARSRGLVIPVVYNSNGYDAVAALRRIRGLIDIYLPDIKYMDNRLGKRYSGVDDYADIIPAVLEEMRQQVGDLETDRHGIARRGLLVRHLVLPGCPDNSRKCLRLLAGLSPDIHLSIMSQYSPQYKAAAYPEINRTLTAAEYDEITDYALELGLENGFVQDPASRDCQLPDFDLANPFT